MAVFKTSGVVNPTCQRSSCSCLPLRPSQRPSTDYFSSLQQVAMNPSAMSVPARFLLRQSSAPASLVHMLKKSYHEKVIDHYENPRNVGSLDKNDPTVGTGIVGAPACGDVMKLQIKVDDKGKIVDAKFKTFGCGSAIASSSLATEWIKGRPVEYAAQIKNQQIAKELSLPPVKLHCSMLAQDAIQAALSDYQKKQGGVAAEKDASASSQ